MSMKDSNGKSLEKARSEAATMGAPFGCVVVLGRWYANGSLSQKWTWAARFQRANKAPYSEEIGGARFRAVETVSTANPAQAAAVNVLVGIAAVLQGHQAIHPGMEAPGSAEAR